MAVFDESKVINSLHTDRAEVGKKYYFSDSFYSLKQHVEREEADSIGILDYLAANIPFNKKDGSSWELIYPYEEPPKKLMTRLQLMEWLAKGNGMYRDEEGYCFHHYNGYDFNENLNFEVSSDIEIRSWNSDEWVTPTVDIYERDCK